MLRAFGATEGKPLIEPSVPAAASRAAPPLGTTRCGIGSSPCTGQRRTLQKRLERQPASAVTTSPSAGWTCASARPRTAVATRRDAASDELCNRESEGAPPLTAGLAAHRPTKHPLEHLYKYKCKGDLLQVVNAPGGSGKTLALATLLAEQEEIRSRRRQRGS